MAQNPEFEKSLDNLKKLHNKKNTDYAKENDPYANFRECEKIYIPCEHCGKPTKIPMWAGILVRMSDKWVRLLNLTKNLKAKNENIEDTYDDLSFYSQLGKLTRKK